MEPEVGLAVVAGVVERSCKALLFVEKRGTEGEALDAVEVVERQQKG